MKPLADKIRPEKIEDFVGQSHLIGKNKIISSIIKSKKNTKYDNIWTTWNWKNIFSKHSF